MAAGSHSPDAELRVLSLLRETMRETARRGRLPPSDVIFVASWVARESGTAPQDARAILAELATSQHYVHPWLHAFIKLRCPVDDRELGLVDTDGPVPETAVCPEDGEVQLDPDRNQLVFKPTTFLLEDAEKKTAV